MRPRDYLPQMRRSRLESLEHTQQELAPPHAKGGLPEIRFHDLRHTCATLLLSKNVHPKIVQEMLGHANVAITIDTHSDVLPGIGDQAASAMENVLL